MLWLALMGGAVAARMLLASLRKSPQRPFSRALLFEFSVRKGSSDRPLSRRERVWTGVARVLSALACLGAGAAIMTWADRFPNLSTTNHVLSGIGFVLVMLAILVALSGVIELVRAPFAASEGPTA
jgi:hypothetical protein